MSGEVEVEGSCRDGGTLLARTITLEDDGEEGREAEVTGASAGLSASATEFDDIGAAR